MFVIQELPTHSGHEAEICRAPEGTMDPLHQCTTDSGSEDFILVPHSSQGTISIRPSLTSHKK